MPFTNEMNHDDVPRIEDAIVQHPLGGAIARGDVAAVTELLARGADANAVVVGTDGSWSQWELPMLHIAARHDRAEVARMLLSAGARIDARSRFDNFHWPDGFDGPEERRDALEEAASCGGVRVLELLREWSGRH
jgi:ankyrin repeat protein